MSLQYCYQDPLFSFGDIHRLVEDTVIPRLTGELTGKRHGGLGGERQMITSNWPRMDVYESPKENIVNAIFELPGLRKEDICIDVTGNRLVVSGECNPQVKEMDQAGLIVRERKYGKFSRSLPLPTGVRPEQVKAQMNNGLLIVTYPKTTQEQQAKRIQIS